jgi:hypothetical protein
MADVEGVACYEVLLSIMMVEGEPRQSGGVHWLLFFREDDLALVRIDRYQRAAKRNPAASQKFKSWPCFPLALDAVLPLSWPSFDDSGALTKEVRPASEGAPSQKADSTGDEQSVKIVLSRGRAIIGDQVETVQTWTKNKPWWVSARQTRNGKVKCECKLVSWREVWASILSPKQGRGGGKGGNDKEEAEE